MKTAKICLFLIISVVVFTGVVLFFQRGTTSQETVKVYKNTTVSKPSEEVQLPHTHAQGKPHSHAEDTPHPPAHETPSDSMIQLFKDLIGETSNPKTLSWLTYLESEEGRAFFDNMPSSDEWFEKSKSFGFFQETPELQAWRERRYRKFFPTGTVDENASVIRDMMKDAILEHEHHKEEAYSRRRNSGVLLELLMDDKYHAWVMRKFGSQPPSSHEWIDSTFEEVRLAEREKYLAAQKNGTTAPINDFTETERPQSERPQSEIELPPRDRQTPANTLDISEDLLTVEEMLSDDANIQQSDIEKLTPTSPEPPELPTNKRLETELHKQFSPERFHLALQTLNRYGPEEGLRRLKDTDPEVAKQVERLLPKQREKTK